MTQTPAERAREIVDGFVARKAGYYEEDVIDGDTDEMIALIASALTPPKDHVRTADGKDIKVLGTLRLTGDGCIVAGSTTLYYVGANGPRAIEVAPVYVGYDNERYDIGFYNSAPLTPETQK